MHTFNNLNPNNFMDELVNSKILPKYLSSNLKEGEYIANNIWVEFEEGVDMEKVHEIVKAHDPTPLPSPPSKEDYLLDLDYRLSAIEIGV